MYSVKDNVVYRFDKPYKIFLRNVIAKREGRFMVFYKHDNSDVKLLCDMLKCPIPIIRVNVRQITHDWNFQGFSKLISEDFELFENELLCNVMLCVYKVKDRIMFRMESILVLAINNIPLQHPGLPNIVTFKNKINSDSNYNELNYNDLSPYVLSVKDGKYIIVEDMSDDSFIRIPIKTAWKISEEKGVISTSKDGKYHYRIVVPGELEDVKRYMSHKGIDVRGIWQDEGRYKKMRHVNIHAASKLPLPYFNSLLDDWPDGRPWCDNSFEPYGWRVYAARNHNKDEYITRGQAFKRMFIHLGKLEKDVTKITRDEYNRIANFNVIY